MIIPHIRNHCDVSHVEAKVDGRRAILATHSLQHIHGEVGVIEVYTGNQEICRSRHERKHKQVTIKEPSTVGLVESNADEMVCLIGRDRREAKASRERLVGMHYVALSLVSIGARDSEVGFTNFCYVQVIDAWANEAFAARASVFHAVVVCWPGVQTSRIDIAIIFNPAALGLVAATIFPGSI